MKRLTWAIPFFVFWAISAQLAHALDPTFADRKGNAIRGYDPVAYFTEGEPAKGSKEFSYDWNGATWRFVSQENQQAFAANPEKYAPQYGGYCAWAVSQGYTASTDPLAWNITDGRLFLNYSKSVQANWLIEKEANITQGDINWPGLSE